MKANIQVLIILFSLCYSSGFSQVNHFTEDLNADINYTAMMNEMSIPELEESFTKVTDVKITKQPQFRGSLKYPTVNQYISSKVNFPEEARIAGREGLVKVQFEIYPNGSIGNIIFLETPDISFNREVETLLQEIPQWRPAYSGDVPVTSRYQLNINFSLQ